MIEFIPKLVFSYTTILLSAVTFAIFIIMLFVILDLLRRLEKRLNTVEAKAESRMKSLKGEQRRMNKRCGKQQKKIDVLMKDKKLREAEEKESW